MSNKDKIFNIPPPSNDGPTHIKSEDCWCLPRIEENGKLIIHRDDRKKSTN